MAGFCIVSITNIDHCEHYDCLALYKNSKNKSCEIVTNGVSNEWTVMSGTNSLPTTDRSLKEKI